MRIQLPNPFSVQEILSHAVICRGQNSEKFQLTVLENDIIRVQHFPDELPRIDRTWSIAGNNGDVPLEGRLRTDLSSFSLPSFSVEKSNPFLKINTQNLQVTFNLTEGSLSWKSTSSGDVFAKDLLKRSYAYDRNSETVFHYMERRDDEHYYGFGERSGALDKYGRRMRMVNLDALGYNAETGDPLYKHIPFYITYIPNLKIAYGLFYDNLSSAIFDMGLEKDNYYGQYRYYQADAGDLDYYLIYGPEIISVVEKFSKLIGRPALPPRWSLGYLGSSMLYTDAENAQQALNEFIFKCEENQIPCDMFHLSSGYGSGKDGKRYVFTWNNEKIPDPTKMVERFHNAGINLMANIKPCLLETHPLYEEASKLGLFIRDSVDDKPRLDYFWDGYGSHLDFTNPTAYDWWQQNVKSFLLDYGIDGTWNDNNEYPVWDDEAKCNGFGRELPLKYIRPLHPYLMVRSSLEAQLKHKPDERPFLLSRSASPGTQRYAQTWSGDNDTSWNTLQFNIPMGLGLSLSGFPNFGHDIGGFTGPGPSAELFVRWVQNGIFHPRFTIHSWNNDGTVNTPWMHPEVISIIRETINFRYRLIPYLYTQFFEAARSGTPIMRPLVYQFPHDEKCITESFNFMVGPNLLVSSVVEPGEKIHRVYLPKGNRWVNFSNGSIEEGGQTIEIPVSLENIPLFVIAGSILPMKKKMRNVREQPDDIRYLYLFPDSNESHRTTLLVEDDGISMNYKNGEFTELFLTLHSSRHELALEISFGHNGYKLPYDLFEIILPSGEMRPLKINAPEGFTVSIQK